MCTSPHQICHDAQMGRKRAQGKVHSRAARRLLGLIAVCAMSTLAACGSSSSGQDLAPSSAPNTTTATTSPTTTLPPTTTEAAPAVVDLSAPGPYPVGVTTRELSDGSLIEIWYPAIAGTTGTEEYDLRGYTPDFLTPLLTNVTNAVFAYEASRDAAVDPEAEAFPLVVFSHGFAGMRVQSTTLTSHLASHGMVVVSPDHPSRDLRNVLGGTASGQQTEAIDQLTAVLDLAAIWNETFDGAGLNFRDRIDLGRIALIGHSAGGASVQGAASDPRISGYVALAAGGPPEGFEPPAIPGFFVAGSTDGVISPTERTRPAHLNAATPNWYLEIAQTGHNGFDDFCLFGDGTGIVGVAEQAGLGAILQAQPTLRVLGEDGCLPPAAPVELAHPLINHAVTVWLQWLFGAQPDLLGLEADSLDRFALGSVITERR
jgi:predicted dienelactone hydrolase